MKISDVEIQDALESGGAIRLPGYSDQMAVIKSANDGQFYFCNPENFQDPQHLMDQESVLTEEDWLVYIHPSAR